MICKPISQRRKLIFGVVSLLVLVMLYSWLSYRQHQANSRDKMFPNYTQMCEGVKRVFTPDEFGHIWLVDDAAATGERLLLGVSCGVVLSLIVGILMGVNGDVSAVLFPPISFLSRIPPTAMLAVYFVVFGVGAEFFVAIVAFGLFPAVTMSIYSSVQKDVGESAIHKAYTLGASHFEVILNVIFPQVLPRIIQTIQYCVGPAMIVLIAGEWMMADVGFGYRLRLQSRLSNMNVVYTYLVVLGVAGFAIDWMLVRLRRRACPWFGE